MTHQWGNKRFKSSQDISSASVANPGVNNNSKHTNCSPAGQIQTRDSGRQRFKKLCTGREAEWGQSFRSYNRGQGHRQAETGQRFSNQQGQGTNQVQQISQQSSFQNQQWENLLQEW